MSSNTRQSEDGLTESTRRVSFQEMGFGDEEFVC